MREHSLPMRVGIGFVTCLALVGVYLAGTMVAKSVSSPEVKTEIGHMVEGDPLAGLELDSSQYGTETAEERDAIGDCFETRVGVRTPEELETPSFEDLYAWRECAVELGIESKVMMIESPSRDERQVEVDGANKQIREQRKCLKGLGWRILPLAKSKSGIINFTVDAEHDLKTEERLAADSATCGVATGEGHGH